MTRLVVSIDPGVANCGVVGMAISQEGQVTMEFMKPLTFEILKRF